jgi:hypothetical protein
MPSKAAVLVVISFLVIASIFSSSSSYVLAKPVASKGSISCNPNPLAGQHTAKVTCCQTTTYTDNTSVTYCTDCDDTKPPSNCGPRYINPLGHGEAVTPPIPIPPPPKNAPPPSETTICPDGSAPDSKGNCPTTTTANQQVASPSKHHHKGSNLLGQESTKKGNNNSSSSP